MTAVSVISIKLPTAVEIAGIERSVRRNNFGLRFLAAIVILGRRVRLHGSLTRTLPCRFVPDLSTPSRACATKRLSGIINQSLPNGDGLQICAFAFSPSGGGRSTFAPCRLSGTGPILRHAEGWYGCRLSGRKRKSLGIVKLSRRTQLRRWCAASVRAFKTTAALRSPRLPRGGS